MNKKRMLQLLQTNLIYVNPQNTAQLRKKGKTGAALSKGVLRQSLLISLIFIFMYTLIMMAIDFSKLPGYFTYYVALYTLMGMSQSITSVYNVFFESKDLPQFLPLPFSQKEIFTAKFAVVAITVIPFLLPLLALFFLTSLRSGDFFLISGLISLLLFFLIFLLVFALCTLVVFGLTKTKFFANNKKLFSTVLLVVPLIVMVGGIMLIQLSQPDYSTASSLTDRGLIWPFVPFYYLAHQVWSLPALGSLLGIIVLLALCWQLIAHTIIPDLYKLTDMRNIAKKKRHVMGQGLSKLLLRYNSGLVKDPSLLMQVLSTTILLPVVMMITFGMSAQISLQELSLSFGGVFFVAGIVFSMTTIGPASFVANLISMDRENFLFVRSLPLSLKHYLRIKFWYGTGLQMVITGILLVIGSLVLKIPVLLALALILGDILGSYLMALRYFKRDYRLLNLTWTNVSQLFNRGGGNYLLMLSLFGFMIGGGILVGLYAAGVAFGFALLLNSIVVIVIAAVSILLHVYYQRSFWAKFSNL